MSGAGMSGEGMSGAGMSGANRGMRDPMRAASSESYPQSKKSAGSGKSAPDPALLFRRDDHVNRRTSDAKFSISISSVSRSFACWVASSRVALTCPICGRRYRRL